jgi:putative ABC transport system ATP-binding protein
MITLTNITKDYFQGDTVSRALRDIDLHISEGEFVAIMGPSGSGKSTMMHIIGALDVPTSGKYILDGQEVQTLSDDKLSEIRNKKIGFVFQAFNLLPRMSIIKNVALPLAYINDPNRIEKARKVLALVGLEDKAESRSNEISGGQMQRVAIARALITKPRLILADEPTGNLDSVTSEEIMHLFGKLHDEGNTIIMVTHEHDIAAHAGRVVTLRDGLISEDIKQTPLRHTQNYAQ